MAKRQFNVRLDASQIAWLDEQAQKDGTTVTALVERAIEHYRLTALSLRDSKAILDALDNTPEPSERLKAAALDYKDMKALAARIDTRKPTRGKKVATREDVKDVYAEGLHVGMDLGKKLASGEEPPYADNPRCVGCKHPKKMHWARGCVAGCNCSERRFR